MIKGYKAVMILASIGIALAIYLLYEYIALPTFSPCYINSYINCEASTKGPLANTFGIPTALYGLTGYFLILIGALRRKPKLIFGMATFGLLFCLRITFLEFFVVKAICPVCMACQVDMLITFILSVIILKKAGTKS